MAQVGDLDPLVLQQEPIADLAHGQPLQRGHEPDHLGLKQRPAGLENLCDRAR
jgi:hypothetical protein